MSAKVSIVISAYNRPDLTRRCLKAVQDYTEFDYELVMINDGSTDPSIREIMSEAAVYIEHPKNQGVAPSWADGVDAAGGSHICILDNDAIVTPRWLTKLMDGLERRGFMMQGNSTAVLISPLMAHQAGYFIKHGGLKPGNLIDVYAVGGIMLFRRELLEKVGNFDRELATQWSDLDLCLRIRSMQEKWTSVYPDGAKIVLDTTVSCYHPGWIDPETDAYTPDLGGNTRALPDLNDLEHLRRTARVIEIMETRWNVVHGDKEHILSSIDSLERLERSQEG